MAIETKPTPLLCDEEEVTKRQKYNYRQNNFFAFVIYPDEDPNHKKFLDYVSTRERYKCVWIVHDKDDKKTHVHLLIKTLERTTVKQILKFFDGWVDYAEAVTTPSSYMAYMLHDTPQSMDKHLYPVTDLHGDVKMIEKYLGKNCILRNLSTFAELSRDGSDLCNIVSMITTCDDKQLAESLLSTLKEYQGLIVAMNNQQVNKRNLGKTWWLT